MLSRNSSQNRSLLRNRYFSEKGPETWRIQVFVKNNGDLLKILEHHFWENLILKSFPSCPEVKALLVLTEHSASFLHFHARWRKINLLPTSMFIMLPQEKIHIAFILFSYEIAFNIFSENWPLNLQSFKI